MKNFIRTLQFGKPYKGNLILLSLSSFLTAGIGLIYLLILKNVVNIFYNKDFSQIKATLLLSTFLYIIKSIIAFFSSYLSMFISEKITLDIKKSLFSHILSLPVNFFKTESEGALMSRLLNDTVRMEWLITNALIKIAGQPLKVLALFAIAFWINIKLAFVLLFFIPLSFIVIKLTSKIVKTSSSKLIEISERLYSFLEQKLYGIEIVKALTNENRELAAYETINREYFLTDLKRHRFISLLVPLQQILMGACVIIIMWVGTKEVSSHHLSPGSFAAFGAVSISIYSLLTRIGRTYTRFQISMKSCERVFDIFDKIPETSGEKPFPENFQQIEIRSLSFPYLRGVPVLENISLDISEGETILLKGSSGSGKTTLLRLLLGFYKPVSGSIVINSIPVTEYGLSSLRGKINMVPQETILFNDTIENNVIYGSFEKDEKRLNKALNLSRCDTFVPELEKGINTVTGDRGVKLSAGQKQRIAIARALLRGGTVLLLDEATSAIDEKTEKKILSNVINSGIFKTIVLVSHRSSLEKFADRIYSLEEGKARLIKDNRPEK